jgi:hypothetical protein
MYPGDTLQIAGDLDAAHSHRNPRDGLQTAGD